LSDDERMHARIIEQRITTNLKKLTSVWQDIVADIATFHQNQLWREQHTSLYDWWINTFSRDALKAIFGQESDRRQQQLIKGLEATVQVIPVGVVPLAERQARELTALPTPIERQKAALVAKDLSDNTPTSTHFKQGAKAVKAGQPNEFTEGETVYVNNERSPHHQQPVIIRTVGAGESGLLVMASPADSPDTEIPFVKTELDAAQGDKDHKPLQHEVKPRKTDQKLSNLELINMRHKILEHAFSEALEHIQNLSDTLVRLCTEDSVDESDFERGIQLAKGAMQWRANHLQVERQ